MILRSGQTLYMVSRYTTVTCPEGPFFAYGCVTLHSASVLRTIDLCSVAKTHQYGFTCCKATVQKQDMRVHPPIPTSICNEGQTTTTIGVIISNCGFSFKLQNLKMFYIGSKHYLYGKCMVLEEGIRSLCVLAQHARLLGMEL